ncbi:MAG: hypothetical protein SGI88_15825 [Candidatus Hydrogenedentes bacterium]|nr:hypothetical protein [Candidatus Hydrogenedentota bacterium]
MAVSSSWAADRTVLEKNDFGIRVIREREGYVEAVISKSNDSVVIQWATDSAFRFFPLMEHEELGLTLHPFDLATNKVLALVGRVEVRDWIDIINCHTTIQRFGYLAWAASAKDPGFSAPAILCEAARTARYSGTEVSALDFGSTPPDAVELGKSWHEMLKEAQELVPEIPPEQSGTCLLNSNGALYGGDVGTLREDIAAGQVRYHRGQLRGAYPQIVGV